MNTPMIQHFFSLKKPHTFITVKTIENAKNITENERLRTIVRNILSMPAASSPTEFDEYLS
jgi:hypothetical protein